MQNSNDASHSRTNSKDTPEGSGKQEAVILDAYHDPKEGELVIKLVFK